jgi:hypothetical protein
LFTSSNSTYDTDTESTSHSTIQFAVHLSIYEFPYRLGDNPSVSSGVPVALDWNLFQAYTVTPDEYARQKEEWQVASAKTVGLARWRPQDFYALQNSSMTKVNKLSMAFREHVLLEEGYRRKDLDRAIQKVMKHGESIIASRDCDDDEPECNQQTPAWVSKIKGWREKRKQKLDRKKVKKAMATCHVEAMAKPEPETVTNDRQLVEL